MTLMGGIRDAQVFIFLKKKMFFIIIIILI